MTEPGSEAEQSGPTKGPEKKFPTKTWMRNTVAGMGKLKEFFAIRESLKKEGMTPIKATQAAYTEIIEKYGDQPTEGVVKDTGAVAPNPKMHADVVKEGKVVIEKHADSTSQWRKLAKKAVGKSAKHLDIVSWVANNLDTPLEEITECPSPAAVSLLKRIRATSALGQMKFFTDMWTKTFPNRTAIEAEARFQDDGRDIIELIDSFHPDDPDKFNFPVLPDSPEGGASEPTVP